MASRGTCGGTPSARLFSRIETPIPVWTLMADKAATLTSTCKSAIVIVFIQWI
jgi:hypothetical protein